MKGSETKFSYQRLPWISCEFTKRFRNANIADSYALINKLNFLVLYVRLRIHCWGKKNMCEWKEILTKGDMVF